MWGITGSITDAVRQAPMAFLQGVEDIFVKPPQAILGFFQGLSPEDQKLLKDGAVALLKIGAKAAIAYAQKGS